MLSEFFVEFIFGYLVFFYIWISVYVSEICVTSVMAGFGGSNPSHLYVLNTSIILPCPWDRVKMSLPNLGSSVYSDTGYFSSII